MTYLDMIRSRRAILKLTQEQVANAAGISRTSYSFIENGEQEPRLKVAISIAKALGIDSIPVTTI